MDEKIEELFKSLYAFDPFSAYPKEADFAIPEIGKLAGEARMGKAILRRLLSMYYETNKSRKHPYTRSACAEAFYQAACHRAPMSLVEDELETMLREDGFDRFIVMALVRSDLNGVLKGKIDRFLTHDDTNYRRAARACIESALKKGAEISAHLKLICKVLLGEEAEAMLWAANTLLKAAQMKQNIKGAIPALEKAKEIKDSRIRKKVLETLELIRP